MKKKRHGSVPFPATKACLTTRPGPERIICTSLGLLVLSLSCCSDEPSTSLGLTVEFSVALDQIEVSLQPQGETAPEPGIIPQTPTPLASGLRVLLLVPDAWDGKNVTISVAGLSQGKEVAHGKAVAKVYQGQVTDVLVQLAACSDACVLGASECVGDKVRKCEKDSLGCASWSVPQACPAGTPYCSGGVCSATCINECAAAGSKRCAAGLTVGIQVCGQHDSDKCLDWGPVLMCSSKHSSTEICSAGACVPSCGGKPCPCTAGQTQTCPDTGECKGGVRKCISGSFGPCEWKVGPSAEACDGKDNDCNGKIDDGLVAPGCSKQSGVCKGSVKKCGGSASWSDCTASDYQGHASKQGLVYEATEKSCDGKDNDCNGKIDEPSSCCQPNCTGRQCGPDPVCGLSCGTCKTGTCSLSGKCITGCTPVGPITLDSTGAIEYGTSLALDASGKVYISYFEVTSKYLKYATNASGSWQTSIVDSKGDVGCGTSLGIDSTGKFHISYFDSINQDLKYTTNASGSWQTSTVDSKGDVGCNNFLGLDSSDKVHIGYGEWTNEDLKYATNSSGSWQTYTIDSQGIVGDRTSLNVDSADKVHISYRDYTNEDLKYATNASGSWQTYTIDSLGVVGEHSSLDIDSAGKVHISCTRWFGPYGNDLRYATNASGSWQIFTNVSQVSAGEQSLGIDSTGKVHIGYWDHTNNELKYTTNASGSWQISTVDSQAYSGYSLSLGIDGAGKVHIGYTDDTNKNLKYVAICP